ncbi:MAG: GspH/FimT family pseudopilin [Deltaproteobacteria bacterium]|nr:GspH/FimT family pseudopilin [Deltaproteobacteria bacterium]
MQQRMRFFKKQEGFTLLELIMTMVILAILATIAIPTFSVWLPEYRLKKAARDLYSNIQLAKMQAVRTNRDHTVSFNTGAGLYQVLDSGVTVVKTVNLSNYGSGVSYGFGNATKTVPGGVPIDTVSYAGDSATFNPRGTGGMGYVYLTNERSTSYAVGTITAGAVVLRKWNGADWE